MNLNLICYLHFQTAGLTTNNNICNIPFFSGNDEKHFCLSSGSTFKCEIGDEGSGILEDCVKGK